MSGKTKAVTTEVQSNETQTTEAPAQETQATPALASSGANDATPPAVDKVFTQADFDRTLAMRLQQERNKFADYDQLKAKIQELESATQTERQRAEQLAQQNQQLATTAQQTSKEASIVKAASAIGLDAEAAVKLADMSQLQLDEAGNITNAADLVKAVAEKFPGLLRRPMPQASAVNPPAQGDKSVTPEVKAARQRAEYFGGGASSFWNGSEVRLPLDLS